MVVIYCVEESSICIQNGMVKRDDLSEPETTK